LAAVTVRSYTPKSVPKKRVKIVTLKEAVEL
jgi:hypothetical protein